MKEQRILIVDDEEPMRELLPIYLKADGYPAEAVHNGVEAIARIRRQDYDLILLDLMMPGPDGFEVCRHIRELSNVPIIMLTARGQTTDKVVGLRIGADDYVTKPFEQQELLARIATVFRREQLILADQREQNKQVLVYKGLRMDLPTYQVFYKGTPLSLTPKEFSILHLFLSHRGRVFHRDDILELIWKTPNINDDRTVDTHIKNLREKLTKAGISGQEVIITIWGTGYICK